MFSKREGRRDSRFAGIEFFRYPPWPLICKKPPDLPIVTGVKCIINVNTAQTASTRADEVIK